MEKRRRRARARKCRGNFAADQSRLAHAGDDHASFAREQKFHGLLEARVEPGEHLSERFGFNP
jgi:hypothetical protein